MWSIAILSFWGYINRFSREFSFNHFSGRTIIHSAKMPLNSWLQVKLPSEEAGEMTQRGQGLPWKHEEPSVDVEHSHPNLHGTVSCQRPALTPLGKWSQAARYVIDNWGQCWKQQMGSGLRAPTYRPAGHYLPVVFSSGRGWGNLTSSRANWPNWMGEAEVQGQTLPQNIRQTLKFCVLIGCGFI